MIRFRRSALGVATVTAVFTIGCASVSTEHTTEPVSKLVEQRIGHKAPREAGNESLLAEWIHDKIRAGLSRERAIEIALVNNPDLQATYAELGVSQADMVQAGLLHNPTVSADIGFGSGRLSELRLSLVQDFLDLFVLPLRKEIARDQFEADTIRVAHRALEIAAEVDKAFVTAQASAALVGYRRTLAQTTEAGAALSQKQFDAGNVSPLEHAMGRAAFEQSRLDLTRDEFELHEQREQINRLLGLWGGDTDWAFAQPLPPLPKGEAEPLAEHLESLAIRQRLDLAVARRRLALLAKAVDLARSTRLIGRLEVGVDAHRDPDGPRVFGPNLVIELPIFDQRQAAIARLEAQRMEQQHRVESLAVDVRSEVRLALARVQLGRTTVLHYRDVLLPLRQEITEQTLLHYNGMFVSLYQLLAAKRDEIEANRGQVQALRDYWHARAELSRALGGTWGSAANDAATATISPPSSGLSKHE